MPASYIRRRRSFADWAGFAFFFASAIAILLGAPRLSLLMLPTLVLESMIAVSFLIRRPLRSDLKGWAPKLSAYAGSFLVLIFLAFARKFHPAWVAPSPSAGAGLGMLIWFAGSLFGGWTAWHLRRSFSLEPQARTLVTSGPYRFARHPIYASYLLQYLGVWLNYSTAAFAAILIFWLAITLVRVRFEETVLRSVFPEYTEYAARVGMYGPRRVVGHQA